MSADSPRKAAAGHKGAQVVLPQAVTDKSIIDSVAGIINDIVPQGYASNAPSTDNRETITWARFEYADVNDPAFYPDHNEGSSMPPLLLVLGYNTGVQVWLIAASGEATEVFSWRQGAVRVLRVLPTPKGDNRDRSCDLFKLKRPMVAMVDATGPGPQFCSVSFMSLKTGEQVKSIKFKTPVCDVLANKRSIVITFPERIAVFDAKSLEDVVTLSNCYLSPGPNPNPVALGSRWMAFSENKLQPCKRSSGGCESEGVVSYTATVLHAAKSLGKGLRGLGETVASSLTGNSVSPGATTNNVNSTDVTHPGIVTVYDLVAAKLGKDRDERNFETTIAHFPAHAEAIVAMAFDLTGSILMTADKRGHDFHVFKIQPHPLGPQLAAVHHLYVLHRGDTTAKVQDMAFSNDGRWAAISTVRGTTHVFPVAPYGGPAGVRTHTSPHVVNRLSRFHRSAGLTDDSARSHSPISHNEQTVGAFPFTNPRLPPYPHPTVVQPLAQIRQTSSLSNASAQAQPRSFLSSLASMSVSNRSNNNSSPSSSLTSTSPSNNNSDNDEWGLISDNNINNRTQQRQRLHSDDGATLPLKICACFAPPRAWIYAQRDSKPSKRGVDSLFIMACHGNMIQYDLDPKPSSGVPKEKVCDETGIELDVEAKGQWPLLRSASSSDIVPPLLASNPLLGVCLYPPVEVQDNSNESRWLSQVEIFTHSAPHRRLWMGPQFVFKTYNAPSGVAANLVEAETVEVGLASGSRPARSNPVNMPPTASRPLVPVVIDGSGSSYEQSPRYVEAYSDSLDHENAAGVMGGGENQLREDLAEAMLETSSTPHRVAGRRLVVERVGHPVNKVVNPLGTVITVSADEEEALALAQQQLQLQQQRAATDDDDYDCLATAATGGSSSSSICAEEGRWSMGGCSKELESQQLRDHTEICAEMRTYDEPAIDSVPDENIEELKERRALCAEVARTNTYCTVVDLDRVGTLIKDVPSSPSLCVERGAVPDCSNVVQSSRSTVKCCVLTTYDEEAKNALGRELGYQLVEGGEMQERGAIHTLDKEPGRTAGNTCPSSDDDIEHINSEELAAATKAALAPAKKGKQGNTAASSDDDIEHVLHCDIPESEKRSGGNSSRKRSKEKQRAAEVATIVEPPPLVVVPDVPIEVVLRPPRETEKSPPPKQEQEVQQQQSKKTRIRAKRQSSTNSSDMVEIINIDAMMLPPPPLPPPLVEPSLLEPPTSPPPPPPVDEEPLSLKDMVEIIDIDAMERAEKSSGCFPNSPPPECQILEPPPLLLPQAPRSELAKKKSKRHKKQPQPPLLPPPPPPPLDSEEPEEMLEEPMKPNSWSSIVRRRSSSVAKQDESELLAASRPLFEVETAEDEEEANKENVDVSKKEEDEEEEEVILPAVMKLEPLVVSKKEEPEEPPVEVKEVVLLEEELEKKSDSDQDTPGSIAVERSSSSDEINANAGAIVPMDTEEESSSGNSGGCRLNDPLVSALSEKNVAPGTSPPQLGLLPAGKKAGRSKKKKRR